MTWNIDTTSKRRLSARLAAGIAISAVFALGTFAAPANARDHDNWNGGYSNGGYYNGGYNAPPVVYGSSYDNGYYGSPYYAPPVVYGTGVGISLPFVNLNIR